jgi:membrane protein required for colicin V production
MVRTTLRQWKFEAFDRHLGMILGGLEGATLGIVITVFVATLAPQTRTPILTSTTGKLVCKVLDVVEPILPSEIRAELSPFWMGDNPSSLASQREPAARQTSSSEPAPQATPSADPNAADSAPQALKQFVEGEEKRLEQAIGSAAEQQLNQLTGQGNGKTVERR